MRMSSQSDLRARVGQLLIFGFDGTAPSNVLRAMLRATQPGGIILFKRNVVGAHQTWELLHGCRAVVQTPMFLCVDMEGGNVDRLKDAIAPAPAAAEVFRTGKKNFFRQHGRLIGEEVRALGFNTDFAPVLDLAFDAAAPVMGTRVVSRDPLQVVTYAREFLRGLRDAGVFGCGKHFPGLGEANLDTHKMLPLISKSWKRLWQEDLAPYRELRREMAFVMVAHAAYPEVTRQPLPASLSPRWISAILRKKAGYRGLVISDDLEMGAVLCAPVVQKAKGQETTAAIEQAALQTLRAGADMFLVCHNEEQVWASYEAVVREAERDGKFRQLVERAASRVLNFKRGCHDVKRRVEPPTERSVRRLREQMLEFAERVTER